MNIGIDISLAVGQRSGIGNYAYNLVRQLANIDGKNEYTLFPFFCYIYHPDFKGFDLGALNSNFKLKYNHLPKKWIDYVWKESGIPVKEIFGDLDLLHSTSFCVPEDFDGKLVVTIYDVSFATHPQFHQKANIQHCAKGTKMAVKHADVIIAISEHTKNDLIKHFNCPPEKIKVIYLGYDKELFRPIDNKESIRAVLRKYHIKKPFIFNLGTVEPRKNLQGLVKAYSFLNKDLRKKYDLVIGGGKGWLDDEIFHLIQTLGLEGKVKFLGYVDENDLAYLYSATACFVYPSFYEGFGLPVLEALACGSPVVSSNVSSIPEVVGNGGLLVNPAKNEEISETMAKVLTDNALSNSLKDRAIIQAQKFSWEKCAIQTLEIYQSI